MTGESAADDSINRSDASTTKTGGATKGAQTLADRKRGAFLKQQSKSDADEMAPGLLSVRSRSAIRARPKRPLWPNIIDGSGPTSW